MTTSRKGRFVGPAIGATVALLLVALAPCPARADFLAAYLQVHGGMSRIPPFLSLRLRFEIRI